MKLILKNIELFDNKILVDGVTEIGHLKGIWKNDSFPIVNKAYSVELMITDYCKKISKIHSEYSGMKVDFENSIIRFEGYCEDIDEEVYYIRLNTDWLEMVEIDNDYAEIKKGDFVSFSAQSDCILIFPYSE